MRILIGSDTYPPDVNGASHFSQHLASGLARRGHDVHVVCPSPDGPARVRRGRDGVVEHRVRSVRTGLHPTFRLSPPPLNMPAILESLRTRPDVVHVQGHFLVGRELSRQARRRGIPLLATNHFMPENLLGYSRLRVDSRAWNVLHRLAWRDFARVFNRAEAVTTPTPTAKELIDQLDLRPPVSAVSCGVDLVRFPARPGRLSGWRGIPDRPTILHVGRLDPEKRVEDLVEALAICAPQIDAQLLLVGVGIQRGEIARLAQARGVAGRVIFAGFVADEDLPDAYAACDVFATASIAELQSLATMEAMSTGRPVVAADAMALPHLVRHGRNGFLFPPGEPAVAARHLTSLLADTGRREKMGAASRQLIAAHSSETSLDRYEELYRRLARTREAATLRQRRHQLRRSRLERAGRGPRSLG